MHSTSIYWVSPRPVALPNDVTFERSLSAHRKHFYQPRPGVNAACSFMSPAGISPSFRIGFRQANEVSWHPFFPALPYSLSQTRVAAALGGLWEMLCPRDPGQSAPAQVLLCLLQEALTWQTKLSSACKDQRGILWAVAFNFFLPVLLTYSWYISLYKFEVCRIMIRLTYFVKCLPQ